MTERGKALTEAEIEERLKSLKDWRVERTDEAAELSRVYKFASFEAVLEFMQAAAKEIAAADHHPRWENVYNKLSVHLSTHSLGDRISDLDFRIAKFLEEMYASNRSASAS